MFNLSPPILSETKKSIQLAVPIISSNWLYAINQFAATWMAAQLGKPALAAMAIAFGLYIFAMMIIEGIACGTGVVVAQDLGAQNEKGIRHAFAQGTWWILLWGLSCTLMMWYSPSLISRIVTLNPTVLTLTTDYLHALTWVIFPCSLLVMVEKFLAGLHQSKIVFYLGLLAVPMAIFFNYIFTFGFLHWKGCGIAGLGYGMAIAYTLDMIIFYSFITLKRSLKKYHLFSEFRRFSPKYFYEIWRVGWPLSLLFTLEFGSFMVLTFMMAKMGTSTLAAYQVVRPFLNFAVITANSIAETIAVRIGFFVGEKNRSAIYHSFHINLILGLLLIGSICLIYLLFDKTFIGLGISADNQQQHLLFHYAIQFLIATVILVLIDTLRLTSSGALRGMKDTKTIMISSIIGYTFFGLLMSHVFGDLLHMGGIGLWAGFILGGVISMIIVWHRFYQLARTIDLRQTALANNQAIDC